MSTLKKLPLEAIFNRHQKLLPPAVSDLLTDLMKFFVERDINLSTILNQGMNLTDNFDGALLSYTTNAVPNTQDTKAHGLKRTPNYFIVIDIDKGGVLYRSAAFDNTNVYLKSTVASAAVKVFIF